MNTICTNCGNMFSQREDWKRYNIKVSPLCLSCALTRITADFEEDQAWGGDELAQAYEISGQSTPEDEKEDWEERQRYPEMSDDEMLSSWGSPCDYCELEFCHCPERNEIEDNEWRYLDPQDEEDFAEAEILRLVEAAESEREEQYADWDLEATASDAFWAREEEENAAFSPFWYDLVGSKKYYRFVSPILVGIMRLKKRWRW